jgi:hypothetical protein
MKLNTFLAGFCAGIMFIYYYTAFNIGYFRIYQIPLFVFGLFVILYNLDCGKENKPQFPAKDKQIKLQEGGNSSHS